MQITMAIGETAPASPSGMSLASSSPIRRSYTGGVPKQEGSRMDYETLIYEQDEHVVTLTYNRPDQHNAINRTMNDELHDAWQRFRDSDDAFVLVITGAGETTFSAGWDLQDASELAELDDWGAFRRAIYNLPGPCGYTRRGGGVKPLLRPGNGHPLPGRPRAPLAGRHSHR